MHVFKQISQKLFCRAVELAEHPDHHWGAKVTLPELEMAVAALRLAGDLDAEDKRRLHDAFKDSDLSASATRKWQELVGVRKKPGTKPPQQNAALLWPWRCDEERGYRGSRELVALNTSIDLFETAADEASHPLGYHEKTVTLPELEAAIGALTLDGNLDSWDRYRLYKRFVDAHMSKAARQRWMDTVWPDRRRRVAGVVSGANGCRGGKQSEEASLWPPFDSVGSRRRRGGRANRPVFSSADHYEGSGGGRADLYPPFDSAGGGTRSSSRGGSADLFPPFDSVGSRTTGRSPWRDDAPTPGGREPLT